MNYNYIFFDLDGTLINPKDGITTAVQHALKQYNIHEHPDNLTHFIGPPMDKAFQEYYQFNEKQSKEAVQHFRDYYVPKGMFKSEVYNGIVTLLEKLQKENKAVCVVTTKATYQAEKLLAHHKLEKYFQHIIGSKPDLSDTDKTTLIKQALSFFPDKKKSEFVMIGDKKFDITGAKNNGIDSIGVLYGYGSREEIASSKPTYVVNSIEELEKYLL